FTARSGTDQALNIPWPRSDVPGLKTPHRSRHIDIRPSEPTGHRTIRRERVRPPELDSRDAIASAAVSALPSAVGSFSTRLAELGWVSDLFVAGSLALGDYVPGVSDIDLVAVIQAPLDRKREA